MLKKAHHLKRGYHSYYKYHKYNHLNKKSTKSKNPFNYIYSAQAFLSYAVSLIDPYITLYAFELGFMKSMIGVMTGLREFSSMIFSVVWAHFSDKLGKRKLFVMLGVTLWGLMFLPMMMVDSLTAFFSLVIIQGLAFSMSAPTWDAWFFEMTKKVDRVHIVGNLHIVHYVFSFIASVTATLFLKYFGIKFLFLLGFLSTILILASLSKIKEAFSKTKKRLVKTNTFLLIRTYFTKQKELSQFTVIMFFWSIASTLTLGFLSIYIVKDLGASKSFLAFAIAVMVLSKLFTEQLWEKAQKRLGKKVCLIYSASFITLGLVGYAIAQNPTLIVIANIIMGAGLGGFDMMGYLLMFDFIPENNKAEYLAYFDTFTGVGSLLGPVIGGIIASIYSISFIIVISVVLEIFLIPFFFMLSEKAH